MEINAGFWFFLGSLLALVTVLAGFFRYTIRSGREEARHTRELAQLIAQSTDKHIAEGNQRLAFFQKENQDLIREMRIDTEKFLKEIALRQLQIFERVDRPQQNQ